MSNNNGVSVSFISFGGVITQILTPDAQGKQNNIVLGFDDLKAMKSLIPRKAFILVD